MFRNLLYFAIFLIGLMAPAWVGLGYVANNPTAFAVTVLILAAYLTGACELYCYRQASGKLQHAVSTLTTPPEKLNEWLQRLPASLCNPVRLRIEGERIGLPLPVLTPYLVGLLVLLGMLGTLLGMMVTLGGTGAALQSATDLQAVRDSIAAPVKGLGLAFGTSIAGVATSAMLGLLSALSRRERLQVLHLLDAKIASTLRTFSQAFQREETSRLLQQQAALMPALVEKLQTMMVSIEQHSLSSNERQMASQDAFHERIEASYTRLTRSMEHALQDSITASAQAAGTALQPAIQDTLRALANHGATLHENVNQAVQLQLTQLTSSFSQNTNLVTEIWQQALAAQLQENRTLVRDLNSTLDRFNDTYEQRSADMLQNVCTRLDSSASVVSEAWNHSLMQQRDVNQALVNDNRQTMAETVAAFEKHTQVLLHELGQSHANLQADLALQDEKRMSTWSQTYKLMSTATCEALEHAGSQAKHHQQEICNLLAQTAHDLATQTQSHANATISEVSRLVEVATQAPKAAAEVISELRQNLSDGLARDNAMLEERQHLITMLASSLDSLDHASTAQRSAIDALLGTSADLLDRIANRFNDQVQSEVGRLDTATSQVTACSVEIASLGEAFTAAVQQFGKTNDKLTTRLQRIEGALDKSLTRSDEQLAYYVAQAREVVDLSVLAQRQIIEEMQQLSESRAASRAKSA